MEINFGNFGNFVSQLVYFGGNVGIGPPLELANYHDLEEFLITATNFMDKEIRVTTAFLYWLKRFGILLSPSKLRRIIKNEKIEYRKNILFAFISIIENHPLNRQNWQIIKKFTKYLAHTSV